MLPPTPRLEPKVIHTGAAAALNLAPSARRRLLLAVLSTVTAGLLTANSPDPYMYDFIETILVRSANALLGGRTREARPSGGTLVGQTVSQDPARRRDVRVPDSSRAEHLAVLGKTGTGKTSLIRLLVADDVKRDFGAVLVDQHGDTAPYVVSVIASEERKRGVDLSDRVIVIDPSDPEWAFGLNVLEADSDSQRFIQVSEVTQFLKQRWDLASLGPRTDELLRNSLFVLSAARLTLIELPSLLTNATFRSSCLRSVNNEQIVAYFRERYDVASDAMQAVMRDAVLNKISQLVADPHFRHVLGQANSAVRLADALDHGCWMVLNLPKGRLGDHAATLGGLFVTYLTRSIFARRSTRRISLYLDEAQNIVEHSAGVDLLLAEARKFGVGVVTANQYLAQFPPAMRAAVLSVGTHIFFQTSAEDAERANALIDGGKPVQKQLKELPKRHAIMRRGGHWDSFRVAEVESVDTDCRDLLNRVHARWCARRTDIEQEITQRVQSRQHASDGGTLDGWQ